LSPAFRLTASGVWAKPEPIDNGANPIGTDGISDTIQTVNIHRLTEADVETYVAIRREMLADAPWSFGSSPGEDAGSDPERVRHRIARADSVIMLARVQGEAVGAAGISREERTKRRHIATIWGVFVKPAFRNRGLCTALVRACLDQARGWEGVQVVELAVSQGAPSARRAYENCGFVVWGTEPDALRIDGRSFDEHHMSLRL